MSTPKRKPNTDMIHFRLRRDDCLPFGIVQDDIACHEVTVPENSKPCRMALAHIGRSTFAQKLSLVESTIIKKKKKFLLTPLNSDLSFKIIRLENLSLDLLCMNSTTKKQIIHCRRRPHLGDEARIRSDSISTSFDTVQDDCLSSGTVQDGVACHKVILKNSILQSHGISLCWSIGVRTKATTHGVNYHKKKETSFNSTQF